MQPRQVRIGAVDDHPVILAGLTQGLRWHIPESTVRPIERTVADFVSRAEGRIDVVLLDVELHDGTDAAANVEALRGRGWPVLMFTQDQRHHALARCLHAGAAGILSKGEDLATIAEAVRTVIRGEPFLSADWAALLADDGHMLAPHLTPREMESVRLYAAGMKLTAERVRGHGAHLPPARAGEVLRGGAPGTDQDGPLHPRSRGRHPAGAGHSARLTRGWSRRPSRAIRSRRGRGRPRTEGDWHAHPDGRSRSAAPRALRSVRW